MGWLRAIRWLVAGTGVLPALAAALFLAGADTACAQGRFLGPGNRNRRARTPAPPPPARHPFGGLRIRRRGSNPADEDSVSPLAERRIPRDNIDGRIPHNSTQSKHLEQVEQLMSAGHWDQALELLELVLANSDRAMIRTPAGRPGLVAWEANRLLGRLPSEKREAYRLRHDAQARQLFGDAKQTGNWDQVMDVATRFFYTEAGQEAANAVGNFHFDRGEFGLASLWYGRLLDSAAALSRDPKWRLKLAFALRESGNTAASDELLHGLAGNGTQFEVDVGGDSVKPEDWLRHFTGIDVAAAPVLEEWLQFLGSARRTGTAAGSDPLLLSRWFHPTTQNRLVLDQIESLSQDLADGGRAAIPAAFPLMVNDRVAFRTLCGVHVIEAATGRLLWETRGEFAEESLLLGYRSRLATHDNFAFRRFNRRWRPEFVGGDGADGHPLTGLLFRDANFGLLASDGARLFVVEDDSVIAHGGGGTGYHVVGNRVHGQGRSTPGNRLTAYDLVTGREVWAVGGSENGESFDLPLAGCFFFGAPLIDGGDLFVVAERDLDVRLYALDPESGHVRWSQLLAHSDNKIEQDLGRRWWTAQVAYSNGILVCPTTVDWLVGVDRLDHSVLWMHRYSPPRPGIERREREQGETYVPPTELNVPWCPSAPVIVGNRVIYTPAEEPVLVCLDLSSGILGWQFPKGDEHLYLAGVDDERALIAGKTSVTALSLETGAVQWSTRIEEGLGPPSGRGLIANGKLYLPLKSGALWAIELATGIVVETSQLLPESQPLGNLAMYHGLVLSLNAFGLTAFEQRDAIERQIVERRTTNPRDEWASVKQAQIALLRNDPELALKSLDRIAGSRVEPPLLAPYRDTLFQALTNTARQNSAAADRAIQRLAIIAHSGDERLLVGRLQAEQALAKRDFGKAFEIFHRLAIGNRRGLMLTRPDDPHVSVDFGQWIAGQLAETWTKMSPADRAPFDLLLDSEADRALRRNREAQERFVRLYSFHPASRRVKNALVDAFADQGDLFRAERLLLAQIQGADRRIAAAAQWRLARLFDEFRLAADADAAYWALARDFPGVSLGEGLTTDGLIAARYCAGLLGYTEPSGPDWGDVDLKIYRFGTNYFSQHVEELAIGRPGPPFFRDHRISVDERRQRLEIVRAGDDAQHWLLPLRYANRTRQGEYTVGVLAGHQLVVLHGDVLHFLAPVERRVVWTRPLEVPSGLGSEYRAPHAPTPQPMRVGKQFAARYALLNRGSQRGMLAAANTQYVCVYGRREFLVLDAKTGNVRWKCSNIPQHSVVFGNEDVVYLIPPDRTLAAAYRASDGKRLAAKKLGDLLVNAVAVTGRGLVTVGATSASILGLQAARTVVQLTDPIARREFWKREYLGGTNFALLDDARLLAVRTNGVVEKIDLASGRVQTFVDRYPAGELSPVPNTYALTDRDRIFLMRSPRRRSVQYPEGFRSLPVGGSIVAFDARDGKLLWRKPPIRDSQPHNLVLDFLHDSPMLVFTSRTLVRSHEFGHWSFNLLVIDKRTGREVLSVVDPSASGFRTLELNMAERYIELRSYNQRVRLIAVARAGLGTRAAEGSASVPPRPP